MVLLLGIALLIWRGAKRGLVIGLWVVGAVAVLGLFKYPRHLGAGSGF